MMPFLVISCYCILAFTLTAGLINLTQPTSASPQPTLDQNLVDGITPKENLLDKDKFRAAKDNFDQKTKSEKAALQSMLIGAGIFESDISLQMTNDLYKSINKYQIGLGHEDNGNLNQEELTNIAIVAEPVFRRWNLKIFNLPETTISIAIPADLAASAENIYGGYVFGDKLPPIVSFTYISGLTLEKAYNISLRGKSELEGKIISKTINKQSFTLEKRGAYGTIIYEKGYRYKDGLVHLMITWSERLPEWHGKRLSRIMAASLRSSLFGDIPFILPNFNEISKQKGEENISPVPPQSSHNTPKVDTNASQSPEVNALSFSGTGFFVSKDGHVITNAHVVSQCKYVEVFPDNVAGLPTRIVSQDSINDLALLKVEYHPQKIPFIRVGTQLGEQVVAYGFPLNSFLSKNGNFTLGNITALAGIGEDTKYLQISTPVQPGNSGGPLLDQSGNIVGVVTAKLNALRTMAATGDIPQNVNFALKSSIITNFLESNRVQIPAITATTKLSSVELADFGKTISVFIRCN